MIQRMFRKWKRDLKKYKLDRKLKKLERDLLAAIRNHDYELVNDLGAIVHTLHWEKEKLR